MAVENKFAKIMRNSGPARFFIPIGVILIIFGVFFLGHNTANYVETTGVIVGVVELPYDSDLGVQYDVTVQYYANGKEYTGIFTLNENHNLGDNIPVFYDAEKPENITDGRYSPIVPPAMMAAGVLAIAFGAFKTVKAFKKSKELEEGFAGGKFPTEQFENFKTRSDVKEYYFRFDANTFKPGYLIEDADRKVLFEGKMLKNNPLGARTYEFVNHVNGLTEQHEVGHTVTQSYNDEMFSVKSSFKFDGVNIWELLHNRGLRLMTDLRSKFPNMTYNVTGNGSPFALIQSTGKYVHEDEEAEHKINIPTGRMYYRCWSVSDDLETLFMTMFAISETEQTMVE